jgi:hypothetical protein
MTDTTNASIPRRLVKGSQCGTCVRGDSIEGRTVVSPVGKCFIVPLCFAGDLDERTGMPFGPCLNYKEVVD